jgi:glycine cleavage system aminomethyltransferase T
MVAIVSITPLTREPAEPFEAILRTAGAVFATRDGRRTVVSYGSPPGELAVCLRAVGLADRSELTKLVLTAPTGLARLVERLTGSALAVGGALQVGGAWWCAASATSVVVLNDDSAASRLKARLRTEARHVALTVEDHSDDWAAIELIGRRTPKVLAALGVYGEAGDPRRVPPFTTAHLSGLELSWLLESDQRALALAPRQHAGALWRVIEEAGRPFGLSCVGQEAASRYRLLERNGR